MAHVNTLPSEIFAKIFKNLDENGLAKAKVTCKMWQNLVNDFKKSESKYLLSNSSSFSL